MPLTSKRKIPEFGAKHQFYLVFTIFFLIPQVKYSVTLPKSQDYCKFYDATISNCNAGLSDVKLREIYQNAFFF
jgi:hypothetical protein